MAGQPPLLKFEDFRTELDRFLQKFGAGGSSANNGVNGNRYIPDDDPYTGRRGGHATVATGNAQALHIARRLTFGATPALVAEITSKGIPAWINEQLAPQTIDDSAMESILACFPSVTMSPDQVRLSPLRARVTANLATATMARAVWSKRQLFELMVDHWSNHFSVNANLGTVNIYKPADDVNIIRAHALGKFSDLLIAVTKSPSMLTFLNNASSRADGTNSPNENHARELMELHTVGVDRGYGEADVAKVAHILSGWTIDKKSNFVFDPTKHDLGPAADPAPILGWSRDTATGVAAGEAFLNHLAHHSSTAQTVAYKLCVRFIGDYVQPDDAIVTATASNYLANDTAIAPTLRSLFESTDFKASAGLKARRPLEYIAGTLRSVGASFNPASADSLQKFVNHRMVVFGQQLFGWTFPNGYPDADCKWISAGSMLERWNFARLVAIDGFTFPMFDIDQILGTPAPARVGAVISKLASAVLSEPLDSAVYDYILEATDLDADMRWQSWYDARPLLAYILQSPQNQIR
jgi:uncharacterized protein (DUF1800 family)